MTKQIQQAIHLLQQASHVTALTGAGISTPSGIPDFRSPTSGLWDNVDPFLVASLQGFRQNPSAFFDWLHPLAQTVLSAQPNPAHIALATLEKHGPLNSILTQNIDLLHNKAGSERVYELHGHLRTATCINCHHTVPATNHLHAFATDGTIPHCDRCDGILKPDVILFGELLPETVIQAAQRETAVCDLMIVAGSSLEVAPVNGLPPRAIAHGAKLIIVNLSPTHLDSLADVVIREDVADVLPRLAQPFAP